MTKTEMAAKAVAWIDAATIGSLTTSIFFYIQYGNWHPMVISAGVVASVKIATHFYLFMEGTS